jgi:hypothetical protein
MFRMLLSAYAEPLREESGIVYDLKEKILLLSRTIGTPSLLLQQAAILRVSPTVLKASLLDVRPRMVLNLHAACIQDNEPHCVLPMRWFEDLDTCRTRLFREVMFLS